MATMRILRLYRIMISLFTGKRLVKFLCKLSHLSVSKFVYFFNQNWLSDILHTQVEAEFQLYRTCLSSGLLLCNVFLQNEVLSYSENFSCFSFKYKKYFSRKEIVKCHLLARQPKMKAPVIRNSNRCHLYVKSALEEKIMQEWYY
jgi:hypothetical protein